MTTCACGCGRPVGVARQNDPRWGHRKGEPVRYVRGHHARGARPNERHPMWMGDRATPKAIHGWLRKHFPPAGVCEFCGSEAETDYASINGHRYTRRRSDYSEMCRACHHAYDWWTARQQLRAAGWTQGVSTDGRGRERWSHPDHPELLVLRAAWRRHRGSLTTAPLPSHENGRGAPIGAER